MPVHNLEDTSTSLFDSKDLNSSLHCHAQQKAPWNKSLALSSNSSSSVSLNTLTPIQSNDSSLSSDNCSVSSGIKSTSNSSSHFNVFDGVSRSPLTTSILKPGSQFVGSQQSGRSTYEVSIELTHVDLDKSTLNGFLKIKGLTESYPEIITYFDAEIISEDFHFMTSRRSHMHGEEQVFNTTDDIDLQHWSKFPFWKNTKSFGPNSNVQSFKKLISSAEYVHTEFLKKKFIYMRWKEKFLVPDANVDNIEGASFAGFYYICFNQHTGGITGLYYHKNSEKFQQLELNYVMKHGASGSYQFM